jgi:hypothetical protein
LAWVGLSPAQAAAWFAFGEDDEDGSLSGRLGRRGFRARPVVATRRRDHQQIGKARPVQFLIGGFEHGRICSMHQLSVLEKSLDISVFPSHAAPDGYLIRNCRKEAATKGATTDEARVCGVSKKQYSNVLGPEPVEISRSRQLKVCESLENQNLNALISLDSAKR